ncbi:MAG: DMT family transporter [Verrucomicrobiota bacterium]
MIDWQGPQTCSGALGMLGRPASPDVRALFLLWLGVVFMSTSVLWLKLSDLSPSWLSSYRLLLASGLLVLCFRLPVIGLLRKADRRTWEGWLLGGGLLALHFVLWVLGARGTGTANATLLVNTSPVVMPLLSWLFLREKASSQELWGTAIAVSGLLLLGLGDLRLSRETWRGDGYCLLSMLCLAGYILAGRRFRARSGSVLEYVVPLYLTAGVLCGVVGFFQEGGVEVPRGWDWLWVALVTILPTVLGHTLLNQALSQVSSQTASLFGVTQFLYSGLLAIWLFGEFPALVFYPSALLVVLGVAVGISAKAKK